MKLCAENEAIERVAAGIEEEGMSMTAVDEEGPLFCAMIHPLWPGVVELSALISVRFKENRFSGCRAARAMLDMLFKVYGLHRVQTTVRCDFDAGRRFAEWAGFEVEGIAVKHSFDKVDAFYYAVVR